MQPLELTLQNVLKMSYSFQVPLYQRRYAWRDEQHEQLWRDLSIQYAWLQNGTAAPRHFIGSIVVLTRGESSDLVARWDLVDGQQRLTTLLVLLAAIRDAMDLSIEEHSRFNEKYLFNEDASGDARNKLIPGEDDRTALEAILQGTDPVLDHPITQTYEYFEGQLAATIADKPIDLPTVLNAVLGRVKLVRIEVQDDDSVYQVFESLNATGKPLDQVDLLRSYFFSLLGDEGRDAFTKHWRYLEKTLQDELEFFLWCNLARQGHYINQSQIYRKQQQVIGERSIDKRALISELALLHKLADVFTLIDNPTKKLPRQTLARVRRLNELDLNDPAYPVVLYVLTRLLITKDAKDAEAAKALSHLESYLVRRLLVGKQTNNLNRMLGSALEDIAKTEKTEGVTPVDQALRIALENAGRYWPTDTEVRNGAKANPFYSAVRSTQQKSFVLREVVYAQTDEKPDLKTLQIEHIMPDTLSAAWRKELNESPEVAIELHDRLRHTLGNLTLIGHKANPAMHNVAWTAKRPFYRKSNGHNQALAKANTAWGEVQILARADELAARAIAAWPGPSGSPAVEPELPITQAETVDMPPHQRPMDDFPPVREWARSQGIHIADRGPIRADVRAAYAQALTERSGAL